MKKIKIDLYQNQISPGQIVVANDPHRFKVLIAGRKWRKTTSVVNELIYAALTDYEGRTYPLIEPFRRQAKEIAWEDHVQRLLNLFILGQEKMRILYY